MSSDFQGMACTDYVLTLRLRGGEGWVTAHISGIPKLNDRGREKDEVREKVPFPGLWQ